MCKLISEELGIFPEYHSTFYSECLNNLLISKNISNFTTCTPLYSVKRSIESPCKIILLNLFSSDNSATSFDSNYRLIDKVTYTVGNTHLLTILLEINHIILEVPTVKTSTIYDVNCPIH